MLRVLRDAGHSHIERIEIENIVHAEASAVACNQYR